MGFFRKKKHNLIEDDYIQANEPSPIGDDADDFDIITDTEPTVTRDEFHEMAASNLQEAIDEDIIEVQMPDYIEDEESVSDTTDTYESESETDENEEESDTNEAVTNEEESDHETDADNTDVQENEEIDCEEESEESEVSDDEEVESTDETIADASDSIPNDEDDFDDFTETPSTPTDSDAQNDTTEEDSPKPEKEKKPRMTFSEFREKYSKAIKIAVIVLCVLFVACVGLFVYGCATVPSGVMGRNIYIEDVNVSGLTYEEALEKVKTTSLLDDCDITLTCKGVNFTINGVDVGLTPRVEDTVKKAMNYGKTGNVFVDGFANALQVVTKHTVMPSANVSEPILRKKLHEFGNKVYGKLEEHKLEVGDKKIICTPGHTGFSGDTNEAYNQVIESIENEKFNRISVSLKSAPPKTLTLEDIDSFTYANPQDAHFDVKTNDVTIVPEQWGRYLDKEAAEPLVSQIYEGGNVVYIPFETSEPKIKAADLEDKLFNTTLGSFYTYFGGSSANRAANVANAASKLNNKVLAPGEVFSFNETVGKRSVANGFHPAPEYANGQTVIGIGGGTCQVSSTLYNAVLYSDLAIVYRLNHMFAVGYCPLGQDATVSDAGVDFKFSNNTDYPIKISAVTEGGKITVDILGTQRDVPRTVKIENHLSYSGGNRSVRSYRLVYDPNGTLLRKEDLGSSYYMSH